MSRLYSNLHCFTKPTRKTIFAVSCLTVVTCLLIFLRCDADFCMVKERVTYMWQPENIFNVQPYVYHPNFKNPCWFENLTDNDPYNLVAGGYRGRLNNMLLNLTDRWSRRREQGRTKRLRCLPYFYIAGMPKSGTTDLFWKINMHPQVASPPMKEPHWWSRIRFNGKTRPRTLKEYIDFYDQAADAIWQNGGLVNTSEGRVWRHNFITGEGSASTLWDNRNWPRLAALERGTIKDEPNHILAEYIKHLQPRAKFIVMLRDPTTRLYSDYLYFNKVNKSASDFHERVKRTIKVFKTCVINRSVRSCLYDSTVLAKFEVRLNIGIYFQYITDWFQVFPKEQMLIVRLEEYAASPKKNLQKVLSFLGLDVLPDDTMNVIVTSKPFNSRKKKDKLRGPMWKQTESMLRDFHKQYNQQLANILGDEGYLWSVDS